jgi:hypothetical protein
MGSKSSHNNTNKYSKNSYFINLENSEKEKLLYFYSKFSSNEIFDESKFNEEVFLGLRTNSIFFLNSYYKLDNSKKKIDNISFDDFLNLFFLITKANQEEESPYFRVNTFLILIDIYVGKAYSFDEEIEFEKVLHVFYFILKIYIDRVRNVTIPGLVINNNDQISSLENFMTNNLEVDRNSSINKNVLLNFLEKKMYSINSFIKNHFLLKFLDDKDLIKSTPLLTSIPSSISLEQFLFFVLANPHMNNRKYAFKLWDCKKMGYNIPNLIYSFLGFDGPIAIFVKHFDKVTEKELVLGAFLFSNFKECYEKFCGDEYNFIFLMDPKLKFYKFQGDRDKICYISSKNQKFAKVNPGIGLGYHNGRCRFWIDSNECFNKSYFNKYDDVFEEGSPFDNPEQFLNVSNLIMIPFYF